LYDPDPNKFNVIGLFSEQPFSQSKWYGRGKGFLMSVTNMKKFDILKARENQVIQFQPNKIAIGNDELMIYLHNMTYTVIFGTVPCYFDTRNKDIEDFLGSTEERGKISHL
jgi:hypothetical protein